MQQEARIVDTRVVPVRPDRLNAEQKRRLKATDIQLFAKLYARKAQKGKEPNDRRYSRSTEQQMKRLRPEVLDELLRDEE